MINALLPLRNCDVRTDDMYEQFLSSLFVIITYDNDNNHGLPPCPISIFMLGLGLV